MALNVKSGLFSQSDVRETVTNTEETSVLFNLAYARYVQSVAFVDCNSIYFAPDGLNYYTVDDADDVKQWTMTTRWDISTSSLTNTFDASAIDTSLKGIWLKPDGTKLYFTGRTNNKVYEYDLATAWDLSTQSYLQEFNIVGKVVDVDGMYIREDGKRIFFYDDADDTIQCYNMTTAWDVSTCVYFEPKVIGINTGGLSFSRDGTYLYVTDNTVVEVFALSIPFQVSTAVADSTFTISPVMVNPARGIFFKQNGSKVYITNNGYIREYSIKRGWK